MTDTLNKDNGIQSHGLDLDKDVRPQKKKEVLTNEVSATVCANCNTTTTPLWRRAPNGDTICNACGLYLKARNTLRPPTLKRNHAPKQPPVTTNTLAAGDEATAGQCGGTSRGSCPGGGQCNGTGGSSSCAGCPAFNQHQANKQALICANCRTTTTPLWRRDEAGNTICNACGLYYKLHNVHRPVSMKRSVIKRRKRIMVAGHGSDDNDEEDDDDNDGNDNDGNDEPPHQRNRISPIILNSPELEDIHPITPIHDKRERKTAKRHRGTKRLPVQENSIPVPAIEDYIIPRRTQFTRDREPSTRFLFNHQQIMHPSPQHPHQHSLQPPPPPPPPPPQQQKRSFLRPYSPQPWNSSSNHNHNHHNNNIININSSSSSSSSSSNSSSIINSSNSNNNSNNNNSININKNSPLSLPPISSDRSFPRFDPLSDYRQSSSTSSPPSQSISTITAPVLPPILIPPIRDEGVLPEWDRAMERLVRVRNHVDPSHLPALSRIARSLKALAEEAEKIVFPPPTVQHQL
ncbi:hypothetical protein J3Q64DRAFT_1766566 [Phycomyces blakesleeanus]|uniref:GATA-type domain-containing protein n=2 Tax=Phycomyces blakesleeanus TaxID=4837 RepID=A0ABR3ANE2_PHYBL